MDKKANIYNIIIKNIPRKSLPDCNKNKPFADAAKTVKIKKHPEYTLKRSLKNVANNVDRVRFKDTMARRQS